MKKKLLVCLLVSLVALTCAFAQGQTEDSGNYKVFLISMDQMDQHWVKVDEGARKAAEELGNIDYTWSAPDVKDDAKQIECVNNAVAAGADCILVAPNGPDAITASLQEAVDAGVKIIYVDSAANFPGERLLATDNRAGGRQVGETLLAELTESREYSNMLINERLRVMQVTNHLPLKDVIERITEERVYKTIMHAHNATIMCGIKTPKIVVCGINPHASPGCIFGREDEEIVLPAINRANTHGMNVCGPVDASTAFTLAYLGQFDVIITMYHDQGNPAFMLASIAAAGDSNSQTHYACGTNMTYGLPFIRTSVNSDERFDIAGDGKADPSELKTAVECTLKLIKYNQHI